MTDFGTLGPDGALTHVRTLRQASLAACPFVIFDPTHYRADESCKCDDPTEQAKMIKEWGYMRADFRKAGMLLHLGGTCYTVLGPHKAADCPYLPEAAPTGPGRKV